MLLRRIPSAAEPAARRTWVGSREAVKIRTRIPGWRSLIRAVSTLPSTPGRAKSTMATSTSVVASAVRASSASPAVATTSRRSTSSKRLLNASRTTGWSSTIATRTGSGTSARAGPETPTPASSCPVWENSTPERGNVKALVARAKAVGLTHLYVRTGSTWDGFQNVQFLDQIVPAAHDAGMKVYGWDFPKLASADDDVFRAMMALNHVATGGHRLDGFAADIETATEGTQFSPAAAAAYGAALRKAAGPSTLLVAVVPNPTPQMQQKYSYDAVVPAFDAIAPMVYWLNREPGLDTANALHYLARYGKPLMPIGQAYDG